MTSNEIKLINLIREHDDPGRALISASEIIVQYLNRRESSELKPSVDSRGFSETVQA